MGIRNLSRKKPKQKTKDQENLERLKEKSRLTYFDADKREVKTLKEIFDKTTEVQEVFIPKLGCLVKVGHISMKDFTKLSEKFDPKNEKDQVSLALEMVYYLLNSADDTVTRDMVYGMPYNIATKIIEAVTGGDQSGFQEAKASPTVP